MDPIDLENLLVVATEAVDNYKDPEKLTALERLLVQYDVPENAHVGMPPEAFEGNRKMQIEWAAAQALEALIPNPNPIVRIMAINACANVLEALKDGGTWPPKDIPKPPPIGKMPKWLQREKRLDQHRRALAAWPLAGSLADDAHGILEVCDELIIENAQLRKPPLGNKP